MKEFGPSEGLNSIDLPSFGVKSWSKIFVKVMGLSLFIVSNFKHIVNANVLGVSYQTFSPSASQTDYITVHSTESIRAKKWRMHIFGSMSGNNLFAYDSPAENQVRHNVSDELTTADFGMAYGITSFLEYGLNLPMTINQTIRPESDKNYLAQRWVTNIHNQFKYVFQRRGADANDESGMAVVASLDLPNTRQDGFLGQKENPIATAELVYDKGSEVSSYSFNVGYRWRSPGEPYQEAPVLPLQDQLLFSAAYQKQFQKTHKMSWIAEFYGAMPVDKGDYKTAKDISTAEVIFGVRGGPSKPKRWTVGCGTGLVRGTMSPDWRLFAGWSWDFTWAGPAPEKDIILESRRVHGVADDISDPMAVEDMGPLIEDADRDGVPDDEDLCPRTPRGVKVDRDGCPFDSDNDGVPDIEDKCPNTPTSEVVNSQGCPALN